MTRPAAAVAPSRHPRRPLHQPARPPQNPSDSLPRMSIDRISLPPSTFTDPGQMRDAGESVCKPGSVPALARRGRPSLSGRRCRRPPAAYPGARAGSPRTLPVWPCSGWGLPSHAGHPARWWSLAPPFHPYLRRPRPAEAVCFLWHCPAGHPGLPLTTTLPCGARTFLGGSPRGVRRGRPTDSPAPLGYAGASGISATRPHAGSDVHPTSRRARRQTPA